MTRKHALGYLFGRYPLAWWEEDLLLAPPLLLEQGPTQVSGVRGEAECPTDHWDLKPGEACYTCGAATS